MKLISILLLAVFSTISVAHAKGHKSTFKGPTIWETAELAEGAPCPDQAKNGDSIAYQVNGNGGYVCYSCDYLNRSTILVVSKQVRCSKTIHCRHGKCQ